MPEYRESGLLQEALVDEDAQIVIDFPRNLKTPVSWYVRVLQNYVRGVIRSNLTESEIFFRHEDLLDAPVTPAMQSEQAGVKTHLSQAKLVPTVVMVAQDRFKIALVVTNLEQRSISRDVLLANDLSEVGDRSDRAQ